MNINWPLGQRPDGAGIIARMFNVIGPNDPNGHLIPDLLRRMDAAPGGPLTLRMGNLDRRRDFVDVNDMAAGLACLVGRHSTDIDVYNLCSGREYSASDIALRLAAHRGAGRVVQRSGFVSGDGSNQPIG